MLIFSLNEPWITGSPYEYFVDLEISNILKSILPVYGKRDGAVAGGTLGSYVS